MIFTGRWWRRYVGGDNHSVIPPKCLDVCCAFLPSRVASRLATAGHAQGAGVDLNVKYVGFEVTDVRRGVRDRLRWGLPQAAGLLPQAKAYNIWCPGAAKRFVVKQEQGA